MKKKYFIFVIVILVVLITGVVLYSKRGAQSPTLPPAETSSLLPAQEEPVSESLGAELYEETQNPLKDEVPQTNPFQETKNPFEGSYKNPFE